MTKLFTQSLCLHLFEGVLTAELILRLWSSHCIHDFQGFKGKFRYFKRFGILRALDLLGIITFTTFVYVFNDHSFSEPFITSLRLLHVVQVFQIYRLILPLLKLMISTIVVQFSQLYIAFLFAAIIFLLMSFGIYLKEMDNLSVFDSFWLTYITLTTIGLVFNCFLSLI